jgi:hypothetical protein
MTRIAHSLLFLSVTALTSIGLLCQSALSQQGVQSNQNSTLGGTPPAPKGTPVPVTGDCAAIEDPSINDNKCGALSCAQQALEAQGVSSITVHNDTRTASINLRNCKTNGSVVIVGHGTVAQINTGGEPNSQSNQHVLPTTQNEKLWDNCDDATPGSLCRLRPLAFSSVTLLGCFTGYTGAQGRQGDGIKLLNDVQKATAAKATRAPTGTVFCSDKKFYFLDGADWQNAPSPPAPVAQQPHVFTSKANRFITVRTSDPNAPRYQKIDLNDPQIHVNLTPDLDKKGFPLFPDQLPRLFNLSNLEEPFEFGGCPISGTTGYVVINLPPNPDKKLPATLKLEVLSDGLLRDTSQTAPNVFYRSSPDLVHTFSELLMQLSR